MSIFCSEPCTLMSYFHTDHCTVANMKKSEMCGGFSLETDDRTDEDRKKQSHSKTGLSDESPPPMDTNIQEQMEEKKPQIRFNLNFDK